MSYDQNPYDPYNDGRRAQRGDAGRSSGSGRGRESYSAGNHGSQSRGSYGSYGQSQGYGQGYGRSGAQSSYGSQPRQQRSSYRGAESSGYRERGTNRSYEAGNGRSQGRPDNARYSAASGQRGARGASYGRDAERGSSRASRPQRGAGQRTREGRQGRNEVPQLAGHEKGRRSYSRYDSGARYSAAARQRSNPRGNAGGAPKAAGLLASLPFPGGRRRSNKVHTNSYTKAPSRRIDFAGARPAIIGVLCVAVCAIVAILLWSNRKVNITLNGEEFSIRIGSTCEQVISAAELEPTAGNLVSVSGKTLEQGTGYAFTATLSGNELSNADAEEYRVAEGDTLDISDGGDRMEEYDVQVVDEQPKLEMGGDAWGNISYVSQWPSAGQYEMRTGKQSGETARGDTLTETKNAIITVHQISPDDGRKLVALTFDDGPAESYTESYLEILTKYGIHATFYNLGQNVEAYPDLAKKIIEQGSEIHSHTYQHQQLTTLDAASLQSEFSSAFADIQENAGVTTTAFRPPYGDFNEKAWLNSGGLASVSVLWNQDSLDWKRPGASAIVENCLKSITSGSIILMHDGGGDRSQDVEALPQIIEQLQSQGYEFVTVSELMKSDSSIPADIASCSASMPEGSVWPTEIKSDDEDSTTTDSSSSETTASA